MSAVKTRRASSKLSIEEDEPSSGKPCIDFQPGDRWQLQEDSIAEDSESNHSVNKSTTKKPLKSPTAVNGENTEHTSDSESGENQCTKVTDTNETLTNSDNTEKCNNDSISDHNNSSQRTKKRKNSQTTDDAVSDEKKAKFSDLQSNENSSDSITNCLASSDEDIDDTLQEIIAETADDAADGVQEDETTTNKEDNLKNSEKMDSTEKVNSCASSSEKNDLEDSDKDETSEKSKDETSEISKDETSETSKDETSEISKDETLEKSKDETSERSNEETSERSKDETSEKSKDETSEKSKDETSEKSKDETSEKSKDETLEKSKDETLEKSKDETLEKSKDTSEKSNIPDGREKKVNSESEPKDSSIESNKKYKVSDVNNEDVICIDSSNASQDVKADSKEKPDHTSNDDDCIVEEATITKKDAEDSDGEIEIIGSKKSETVYTVTVPEEDAVQKLLDSNKALSTEELLRSPGYPYFNCLQEKFKNLKSGLYKPVKFPHSGTLYLEDNEVIVESPSLLVPLLIKEADEFPKPEGEAAKGETTKQTPTQRRNFFQSSVGQFLINLGSSRVLEWYHRDMKRSKLKHMKKLGYEKKDEEFYKHQEGHLKTKEANAPFNFRLRHCQHCNFRTESAIIMESHYLTPHMTSRREYKCNFCTFVSRDPKETAFHYEAMHAKKCILENQMSMHECLFCSFQSHLKSKVTIHMNRCRKNFISAQNQSPPYDFEFPGVTTKPVTIADVNAHRRMLLGVGKTPIPANMDFQAAFARKKLASVLNVAGADLSGYPDSPTLVKHLIGPNAKQSGGFQLPPGLMLTRPGVRTPAQLRQGQTVQNFQTRGIAAVRTSVARNIIPFSAGGTPQLSSPGLSITPIQKPELSVARMSQAGMKNVTLTPISSATSQLVAKGGPPQPVALFTNVAGNDKSGARMIGLPATGRLPYSVVNRAPRMIPPYQRLNTPPSQVVKNSSGTTFVMCEICDSYIKDLEELRSHMNWVHKVKIHPKMLVSRPPLNCQKCQWRFFTDQGLERHLLGAHGLVTTNMQEMANKNQDGGRCIICGAVFTYKLVSHMTQVHKVTLKPAHLSYKCTVCTATFTLYRLFESHVYNVHSGSAKRPADEAPSDQPAEKKAATEPEIRKEEKKEVAKPKKEEAKEEKIETAKEEVVSKKCQECDLETDDWEDHLMEKHIKKCCIKLCRIEKCEKCLYASNELILIRMSDFGIESEDSEDSSSEDDDDDCQEIIQEPKTTTRSVKKSEA